MATNDQPPPDSQPCMTTPRVMSPRMTSASDLGRCARRSSASAAQDSEPVAVPLPEPPPEPPIAPTLRRRELLQGAAAGLALAGLGGCGRQPPETIVPPVHKPVQDSEQVMPGDPLWFATLLTLGGYGRGVLVESRSGRPTKVEGNPDHPASLGATDCFAQAEVLRVYDPERSRTVRLEGQISAWERFQGQVAHWRRDWARSNGAGLALLMPAISSPTIAAQLERLLAQFPAARWFQHEPVARDAVYAGARLAFGRALETVPDLSAERILCLDADVLHGMPGSLAHARQFSAARRLGDGDDSGDDSGNGGGNDSGNGNGGGNDGGNGDGDGGGERTMNRLYVVESTPTLTGAAADERLPLKASQIEPLARHLAVALGLAVPVIESPPVPRAWLLAVARDLLEHQGSSLVIAGDHQPAAVHLLAHAMNERLGARDRTLRYIHPVLIQPPEAHAHASSDSGADSGAGSGADLAALTEAIDAGEVETLLIIGGNPVYDAPASLGFGERLRRVPNSVHWGLYRDETGRACRWHLPAAHELESWGDGRAFDGTLAIQQPLLRPIFGGRPLLELLATLRGEYGSTDQDLLLAAHADAYAAADSSSKSDTGSKSNIGSQSDTGSTSSTGSKSDTGSKSNTGFKRGRDFDHFWRQMLHRGTVPETAFASLSPTLTSDLAAALPPLAPLEPTAPSSPSSPPAPPANEPALELRLVPDPTIYDGRFASSPWLQELPKPPTQLVWGNAALIAPSTAKALKLRDGQPVRLRLQGRSVEVPLYVLPGQPVDSVTLSLGYGREAAGRHGSGLGANAYRLRDPAQPWIAQGLKIEPAESGSVPSYVTIQQHAQTEDRHLVRRSTLDGLLQNPGSAHSQPQDQAPGQAHNQVSGQARNQVSGQAHNQVSGQAHNQAHDQAHSLYPGFEGSSRYQWGMSIDLTACIGCKACTIACQAENNIPAVGRDEVARGHEMHWIRVDRYFDGPEASPQTLFQPVPCMHCEQAPCEYVCPVMATVHDAEGLNVQVYNRCIGTRDCSQNCPYKVRRFNWRDYSYQADAIEARAPQQNPDVTVRSRGVMEKCTYCIQRISRARIRAKNENRAIRDGEVVTACQQVCPTEAIVFGNILDEASAVSRRKSGPLDYAILAELNTRPRTTYLTRLRNPNPRLAAAPAGEGSNTHG